MPAKHVSGQEYKYLFNHEKQTPTFHLSRECAGDYTSDMTESAAVRAALDGEMEPCGKCCDEFPLEFYDCPITEVPHNGGWFSIGTKKAVFTGDVDELHQRTYEELASRGMRME